MNSSAASLNWKEIDLILDELRLVDTHIQKIRQPDFHSLIFEHYRPGERFSLYISLSQGKTRLHRLTRKIPGTVKTQRFVQFLRSRILGGRIVECYQIGRERIVKLTVQRAGEVTVLWIRLWGGAPNIIATDTDGTILDAFYRRPKRGEVSGEVFHPEKDPSILPPKKGKEKTFEIRELEGEGSFNQKIEHQFFSAEGDEELHNTKEELLKLINQKESKITNTLENLRKRQENYEQFEKFKQYGDLITAYMHTLQKGDTRLETTNYFDADNDIAIELQPTLSPAENAEYYYKKYKKAKSGLEALEKEIENQESELERLREEKKTVESSEDSDYLSRLKESYSKETKSGKTAEGKKRTPGLVFRSRGFTILVGRNARENDELLRHHVRGNDYWLHARDFPGGYVFIKEQSGKSIPPKTLFDAANLAAYYSKGGKGGEVDLYYTQVKYLRRAKEGKKGLVIPTQEKNITVTVDKERIKRLHEE